jgi:hypothetical protein
MELMDTDDPVKGKLLRKSEHHREQLQDDVKLISEKTEKIITNALVIGAALAATYVLINAFSGSKSKKKKGKVAKIKLVQGDKDDVATVPQEEDVAVVPGIVSQIGTALASQATVMLLSFAKEKLSEYLQSQAAKKEDNTTNERS